MSDLPHGWEQYVTEEEWPYYYCAETGQSSWERPMLFRTSDDEVSVDRQGFVVGDDLDELDFNSDAVADSNPFYFMGDVRINTQSDELAATSFYYESPNGLRIGIGSDGRPSDVSALISDDSSMDGIESIDRSSDLMYKNFLLDDRQQSSYNSPAHTLQEVSDDLLTTQPKSTIDHAQLTTSVVNYSSKIAESLSALDFFNAPVNETPKELSSHIPPNHQSSNIPPMYQSPYIPPSYPPSNIPSSYQPSDIPPDYQSTDIPPIYQPSDIPPIYQSTDIPSIYQPSDGPLNYQPSDINLNYQPSDIPSIYRLSDIPSIYQSTDINLNYHSSDVPPSYQPSDINLNYHSSDIPSIYQPSDIPPNYQPSDNNLNYQPSDIPPNYQPSDIPPNYQPSDINRNYQPSDIPSIYQSSDGPLNYQPSDINLNYQPSDIPPSYQLSDVPPSNQPSDIPFNYKSTDIPPSSLSSLIDVEGNNVLHVFVSENNIAAMTAFFALQFPVARGFIHVKNRAGESPLQLAAKLTKLECLKLLVLNDREAEVVDDVTAAATSSSILPAPSLMSLHETSSNSSQSQSFLPLRLSQSNLRNTEVSNPSIAPAMQGVSQVAHKSAWMQYELSRDNGSLSIVSDYSLNKGAISTESRSVSLKSKPGRRLRQKNNTRDVTRPIDDKFFEAPDAAVIQSSPTWIRCITAQGDAYFYNSASQVVQWEDPFASEIGASPKQSNSTAMQDTTYSEPHQSNVTDFVQPSSSTHPQLLVRKKKGMVTRTTVGGQYDNSTRSGSTQFLYHAYDPISDADCRSLQPTPLSSGLSLDYYNHRETYDSTLDYSERYDPVSDHRASSSSTIGTLAMGKMSFPPAGRNSSLSVSSLSDNSADGHLLVVKGATMRSALTSASDSNRKMNEFFEQKHFMTGLSESAAKATVTVNDGDNISAASAQTNRHLEIWERFFKNAILVTHNNIPDSPSDKRRMEIDEAVAKIRQASLASKSKGATSTARWPSRLTHIRYNAVLALFPGLHSRDLPQASSYTDDEMENSELAKTLKDVMGSGGKDRYPLQCIDGFASSFALLLSVLHEDVGSAEALLRRGADPNCMDDQLRTPTHYSSRIGNVTILALLFDNGADLEARDAAGRTPLHVACIFGSLAAVEFLLGCAVDCDGKDLLDNSPLHFAARAGAADLCRLLVSFGASTSTRNSLGYTPLETVQSMRPQTGELEEVEKLLLGEKNMEENEHEHNPNEHLRFGIKSMVTNSMSYNTSLHSTTSAPESTKSRPQIQSEVLSQALLRSEALQLKEKLLRSSQTNAPAEEKHSSATLDRASMIDDFNRSTEERSLCEDDDDNDGDDGELDDADQEGNIKVVEVFASFIWGLTVSLIGSALSVFLVSTIHSNPVQQTISDSVEPRVSLWRQLMSWSVTFRPAVNHLACDDVGGESLLVGQLLSSSSAPPTDKELFNRGLGQINSSTSASPLSDLVVPPDEVQVAVAISRSTGGRYNIPPLSRDSEQPLVQDGPKAIGPPKGLLQPNVYSIGNALPRGTAWRYVDVLNKSN